LAPRAGGGVPQPRRVQDEWEWEVLTNVVPATGSRPPAAGSLGGNVPHRGGCHCGAVRFEVLAPASLVVWDCNCSDCRMRRNIHFVVPAGALKFIVDERGGEGGAEALAEYRWGTGVARHYFCSRCGVTPFYKPRSNPDGWAVTFQCLDGGTANEVEVRRFDGVHWEDFIEAEGKAIRAFSKDPESPT